MFSISCSLFENTNSSVGVNNVYVAKQGSDEIAVIDLRLPKQPKEISYRELNNSVDSLEVGNAYVLRVAILSQSLGRFLTLFSSTVMNSNPSNKIPNAAVIASRKLGFGWITAIFSLVLLAIVLMVFIFSTIA